MVTISRQVRHNENKLVHWSRRKNRGNRSGASSRLLVNSGEQWSIPNRDSLSKRGRICILKFYSNLITKGMLTTSHWLVLVGCQYWERLAPLVCVRLGDDLVAIECTIELQCTIQRISWLSTRLSLMCLYPIESTGVSTRICLLEPLESPPNVSYSTKSDRLESLEWLESSH